MPLKSIEVFQDEPITLITFEGDLTAQDVAEAFNVPSPDTEDVSPFAAFIIDLRASETTFFEMLEILRVDTVLGAEQAEQGDYLSLFVGESGMLKMFIEAKRQARYGGVQRPLFHTLEDALAAARVAIANANEKAEKRLLAAAEPTLVAELPVTDRALMMEGAPTMSTGTPRPTPTKPRPPQPGSTPQPDSGSKATPAPATTPPKTPTPKPTP